MIARHSPRTKTARIRRKQKRRQARAGPSPCLQAAASVSTCPSIPDGALSFSANCSADINICSGLGRARHHTVSLYHTGRFTGQCWARQKPGDMCGPTEYRGGKSEPTPGKNMPSSPCAYGARPVACSSEPHAAGLHSARGDKSLASRPGTPRQKHMDTSLAHGKDRYAARPPAAAFLLGTRSSVPPSAGKLRDRVSAYPSTGLPGAPRMRIQDPGDVGRTLEPAINRV
ncbi:hypothetical protein METBIDRAFT_175933 [Metschnikowia bicuspidata var. bicuspidata NRRL YB-4993]|uniref:Uncharacterized protein n=1 Tax=Metschnikowia bicuspidata var. bicuspidata NRRL YB-4993 TaxID=869754 RepID=A0A1A0HB56_9ASCO|nr:hypothetical protein METBIDRAFT_175933 [Metschnikowia bicuspidata var. bicuspidata NRRL YB-4993]OBA21123.1 hypothetical protein METBIDRAFT_175933 [Metschnikowia bicuspidata var. bicuspidata NRRL YB-4993]